MLVTALGHMPPPGPPDPTLRAWGTSQGMGSGLGDKDRDGDGAVQGR